MTTYTWPGNIYPSTSTLQWMDNSAKFVSPLSGVTRTVNRPGGRWRLTMQFQARRPSEMQQLEAFLFRLEGSTHRASIPDFAYQRQGTGGGVTASPASVIRVDGASQTGRTLLTDGWTPGELVLKAGDRVSVNGQMLVLAEDCYSSGSPSDQYLKDENGDILYDESSPQQPLLIQSGNAQLILTNGLRSSPLDNALVEVIKPVATYMLAERFEVSAAPGVIKALECIFEESIDA